jgi:hypothetical protein
MQKLFLAVVLLGLLSIPLFAEDVPKFEVFGGYQLMHTLDFSKNETLNGFGASFAGNINKTLSIVGDFGYRKKNEFQVFTYMGGPQINHHADKYRVFAQALLGGVTFKQDNNTNGLGFMFGGGVDIKFSKKFYIRPVQIDLVSARMSGNWQKILRYTAGVVIPLGSSK